MCHRRISHTLLQISVLQVIFVALLIVFIRGLTSRHGTQNYEHIQRIDVASYLFEARSPNIEYRPSLPECSYAFLNSTETITPDDVCNEVLKFKEDGIVNGSYVPSDCNPAFSSAVIVTYRNRSAQLATFIPYMHSFLKKQNIHYKIFIVEQQDDRDWNKGLLYNIGASVAMKEGFPCLILHDVDLFPLDRANVYACTYFPRHMSASIDKFRYVLIYDLVGGALAIRPEHFRLVNGFSNRFLGWGAEDDDFGRRLKAEMVPVVRFAPEMSRYTMTVHPPEKRNPRRMKLLSQTEITRSVDGLSSIQRQYESVEIIYNKLYTLVGVATSEVESYEVID